MPKSPKMSPEDEKQLEVFFKKKEKEAVKALEVMAKAFRKRHDLTSHLWKGLDKDRNSHQVGFLFIEVFGGATFPRIHLMNDSRKDLIALEKAIKKRDWKKIPNLVKTTELRINKFHKTTSEYWNDISSGSTRAIFWTKFAKGVGMAATVALCTTFAAPAVAARLALLGVAEGSITLAAAQAAAGGVLATQIKGVASGTGKLMAGTKIDPYKSGMAQLWETVEAGLFGLITGPASRFVNSKTAKTAATQLKSRATVAQVKSALERTWDAMGKSKAKPISKSVAKAMSGKESIEQVNDLIIMEAVKDPKFKKKLLEELELEMASAKK